MVNIREKLVVILKENVFNYPASPYNPPEEYPELKLLPYKIEADPANHVYGMVRKMFFMYKSDYTNYGTEKWNPLSEVVSKGNTVVIKPNLVRDRHPFGERAVLSTVTHSSLLRPIIDYTILALKGRGKIVICDAPLQSADFNKICEINELRELIGFYKSKVKNVQVSLLDLRKETMILSDECRGKERVIQLKGDPLGYTIIDLGKNSLHSEIHEYWKKYVVTGYDLKNLRKHHTAKKHCYFISNTILNADVIISIPKLKTHKKAGITVALKNSLGVNASKDFLPHHRKGTPQNGGDEYPMNPSISTLMKDRLAKIIVKIPMVGGTSSFLRRMQLTNKIVRKYEIREGDWYGNDTLWRTIVDLNVIVKSSHKDGTLCGTPQRKFLFIVDGIIGQEGEGPMDGHPKKCGVLLLGMNPCAVDYVAAKIMGFNHEHIKQVIAPFERRSKMRYPIVQFDQMEIKVVSNVDEYIKIHKLRREKSLKFAAPGGWKMLEVD
jgi:uncharacterized protein (DUF362 family)